MAGGQWAADVTEATFEDQVLAASKDRPVVVDFWAPWCGPCRQLGPMLESLAAEKDGAFFLAKINTDENPNLAGEFGVSGIPAVFAIRDGKVVDQFTGLMPEPQLRTFLDGLAPSETEVALGQALELEGRDPAAALAAYRGLLAETPDDHAARVGAARVLLATPGREAEAVELLRPVLGGEFAGEAERLRTVITLRDVPHADADLAAARAGGGGAAALLALGRVLAARGEYTAALETLLAAAEDDKKLGAGAVRELMVAVFTVIGARSPEADSFRRKLQSVLY